MRNLLSKVMAGKKKPKNGSEGSQANSESAKPEPTETEQPKEEVAIEAKAKVDSTSEANAATESPRIDFWPLHILRLDVGTSLGNNHLLFQRLCHL